MLGELKQPPELIEIIANKQNKKRNEFELTDLEVERLEVFRQEHEGNFQVIFENDGIGNSVVVYCVRCGTKENITDWDKL